MFFESLPERPVPKTDGYSPLVDIPPGATKVSPPRTAVTFVDTPILSYLLTRIMGASPGASFLL